MKRLAILALALSTALAAAPARAFDLGPLSPLLQEGQDGAWTLIDRGGDLTMANPDTPGKVKYFYVFPRESEKGKRTVSVTVRMQDPSDQARAGILYGFRDNPRFYYLFTVRGDGSTALETFSNGRLSPKIRSKPGSVDPSEVRLTLIEDGNGISPVVNGRPGATLRNDVTVGDGAVGIVAVDRGRFTFSDFGIEPTRPRE